MKTPRYYEFYNPVKVVAGHKALENLPHELKLMQAHKPLIITDQGIVKAGLLQHVERGFDDSDVIIGAIYDQTPVDSSIHAVNEIAQIFRAQGCDSIIAVGGGSVIDTAKGVNIVISENTDDIMQYSGSDRLTTPQKPLVVIPTTAGTGSEVTLVAVISDPDKGVKMPFASQFLLPRLALLDPRMTLSLPPRITAATAMDALTHAIEAYTSLQKNPLSDAYATAAIATIATELYKVVQNPSDADGRFALANAALMAGAAFSNSMVAAVHALGHSAGAIAHVPHGVAMAVLLPHVMQYNFDMLHELYAELYLHLAGAEAYAATPPTKRAEAAIKKVHEMNEVLHKLCNHPRSLSEAGVTQEQLTDIAKQALDDGAMITNPKELDFNDALQVLQAAY